MSCRSDFVEKYQSAWTDYPDPDEMIQIWVCPDMFELHAKASLDSRTVLLATLRTFPGAFLPSGMMASWGQFVSAVASEAGCSLAHTEKVLLKMHDEYSALIFGGLKGTEAALAR